MPHWLLEDGQVALVAMAVLSAEILLVVVVRRASARFLANGMAGLALLGALYCALSERGALIVLACLALGLAAHLVWLSRELR